MHKLGRAAVLTFYKQLGDGGGHAQFTAGLTLVLGFIIQGHLVDGQRALALLVIQLNMLA